MSLRILMYHALGDADEPATRFVLPADRFDRQLRLLGLLRFQVLRLEDAVTTLLSGGTLPRRSVALTFDDGTRDLQRLALPILRRRRLPATAFVVTRMMGATIDWTDHAGLAGRATMTWEEALSLEPIFTLQAHTRTHPSLRGLADAALEDELAGSRRDIATRTGHDSDVFAYPYGHYDERVAAAVATAGFGAACNVKPGINRTSTPAFELRRLEVRGDMTLRRFATFVTRGV